MPEAASSTASSTTRGLLRRRWRTLRRRARTRTNEDTGTPTTRLTATSTTGPLTQEEPRPAYQRSPHHHRRRRRPLDTGPPRSTTTSSTRPPPQTLSTPLASPRDTSSSRGPRLPHDFKLETPEAASTSAQASSSTREESTSGSWSPRRKIGPLTGHSSFWEAARPRLGPTTTSSSTTSGLSTKPSLTTSGPLTTSPSAGNHTRPKSSSTRHHHRLPRRRTSSSAMYHWPLDAQYNKSAAPP